MAEFIWKEGNDQGCLFCGTSVDERGFVDCIGDTRVHDAMGVVQGYVDVIPCSKCVIQMANQVGCYSPEQAQEMTYKNLEYAEETEKLKDEVQAWTQRFNNLVDAISRGAGVDDNPDLALSGVVTVSNGERKNEETGRKKPTRTRTTTR